MKGFTPCELRLLLSPSELVWLEAECAERQKLNRNFRWTPADVLKVILWYELRRRMNLWSAPLPAKREDEDGPL